MLISIRAIQFQLLLVWRHVSYICIKCYTQTSHERVRSWVLVSLDFPNLKLIWCKRLNSVGFKMSTLSIQQWWNFTFRCRVVYKIQILLTFVCLRPLHVTVKAVCLRWSCNTTTLRHSRFFSFFFYEAWGWRASDPNNVKYCEAMTHARLCSSIWFKQMESKYFMFDVAQNLRFVLEFTFC